MTSKAYITNEAEYLVSGIAGADVAFSMENVSDGAGRVSAQLDLGARPAAYIIEWSCECQWAATPTQWAGLHLYYAGTPDADSTQIDGDIGVSDAALADVDMLRNLHYFGSIISENAAASQKCVASGTFAYYGRYISFIGYNDGGATLNATDSNFRLNITLRAMQGQAS